MLRTWALAVLLLASGCRATGPSPIDDQRAAMQALASGNPDGFTTALLVLTKDTPVEDFRSTFWALNRGPNPCSSPGARERVDRLREMLTSRDGETRYRGLTYLFACACNDTLSLQPDLHPSDCEAMEDESLVALKEILRGTTGQDRVMAAEILFLLRYSKDPEILRLVLDVVRRDSGPDFRRLASAEVEEGSLLELVEEGLCDVRWEPGDGLQTRTLWAIQVLGSEGRVDALRSVLASVRAEETQDVWEDLEAAIALAAVQVPGGPGIALLVELSVSPKSRCRWFAMHGLFDRDAETAEAVVLDQLLRSEGDLCRVAVEVMKFEGRRAESAAAIERELRRTGEPLVVEGEKSEYEYVIPAERGPRLRVVRRAILERATKTP